MEQITSPKLQTLFTMLEKEPRDTFLLYGIGMEYKKLADTKSSIEFFEKTIAVDPAYCYAYYQRGQVLEQTGDLESAKKSYREGIVAAQKSGDGHAASELQTALALIE